MYASPDRFGKYGKFGTPDYVPLAQRRWYQRYCMALTCVLVLAVGIMLGNQALGIKHAITHPVAVPTRIAADNPVLRHLPPTNDARTVPSVSGYYCDNPSVPDDVVNRQRHLSDNLYQQFGNRLAEDDPYQVLDTSAVVHYDPKSCDFQIVVNGYGYVLNPDHSLVHEDGSDEPVKPPLANAEQLQDSNPAGGQDFIRENPYNEVTCFATDIPHFTTNPDNHTVVSADCYILQARL